MAAGLGDEDSGEAVDETVELDVSGSSSDSVATVLEPVRPEADE